MSQLGSLLRQITKKSSHPNAFIYKIQLERAKQKYLLQGQLDDGKEDAVALGAPEEEEREKAALDIEKGVGPEAAERKGEGPREGGVEAEGSRGDGAERCWSGGGGKNGPGL